MKPIILVVTCEHAGNIIPPAYKDLFMKHAKLLQTHRGFDLGAKEIAASISQHFACNFFYTPNSRLLIDCNRNLTNKTCFSSITKNLPTTEKQQIIQQYYLPFREQATQFIHQNILQGQQVLHLSVHSFTPQLHGKVRNAAIGLLYNSARYAEREVARVWNRILLTTQPSYKIRMNYPYSGNSDSFVTTLRHQYKENEYLGIELECNQTLTTNSKDAAPLTAALITSIEELLKMLD